MTTIMKSRSQYREARMKVQDFAKKLRLKNCDTANDIDYSQPIHYQERIGHFNGETITRLIMRLRSTGCEWVHRTGGCTMCGFYSATARGFKISEQQFVSQIEYVINEVDLDKYPVVGIYCDGNFFNENEIPMSAIEKMCCLLQKFSHVKKICLESRLEYAPIDRIKRMMTLLKNKQLEVQFGFESANEQVMNLCINKGFSKNYFDKFYHAMQNMGISIKPLVLLKPPFLTEQEAVADVLSTIHYLSVRGVKHIDLEVTTVAKNTVVHELWNNKLYHPPMLWSIIDAINQYKNRYDGSFSMYVSPWSYSVESLDWTKNCGQCDEKVIRAIHRYNDNFQIDVLKELTCHCKRDTWNQRMREVNNLTIPERIISQIDYLQNLS